MVYLGRTSGYFKIALAIPTPVDVDHLMFRGDDSHLRASKENPVVVNPILEPPLGMVGLTETALEEGAPDPDYASSVEVEVPEEVWETKDESPPILVPRDLGPMRRTSDIPDYVEGAEARSILEDLAEMIPGLDLSEREISDLPKDLGYGTPGVPGEEPEQDESFTYFFGQTYSEEERSWTMRRRSRSPLRGTHCMMLSRRSWTT